MGKVKGKAFGPTPDQSHIFIQYAFLPKSFTLSHPSQKRGETRGSALGGYYGRATTSGPPSARHRDDRREQRSGRHRRGERGDGQGRTDQAAGQRGRAQPGGTASKTVSPGMTRESTHVRLGGEKDSRAERSANPESRDRDGQGRARAAEARTCSAANSGGVPQRCHA
jgi:hypothetical protein